MSVLVVYGTVEGQTEKIANFVAKVAREVDEDVHLYNTSDRSDSVRLDDFERVILAASVHERQHPADFEVYVAANFQALDARRTMFLSVSLSAAFPEGLDDAQAYADEMKARTELDPDVEMLIAGAVRTRSYDYYAAQVLRHVVLKGRNYDPAVQHHEFTDWDALEVGVKAFLAGN